MKRFADLIGQTNGYMGAGEEYEKARFVLAGLPMDYTVSLRGGSRFGAGMIREASYGLEDYSPVLNRDLSEVSFYDLGDMELPFGNVSGSLERIGVLTRRLLEDKKFPIFMGGEHLVSYPVIREFHRVYPDLVVLQFDAHADLRSDYLGEENSHATVMGLTLKLLGPGRVFQVGIRSGTREEFQLAQQATRMIRAEEMPPQEAISQILPLLGNRPVYLTLDIDVVDPAYAPGTGTPEAGGCTSAEILEAVRRLGAANVVGFDLVEVSPHYDETQRTSFLAAKIIREALLCF